nr:N-acetyltransferase [Pacificimonas flava]
MQQTPRLRPRKSSDDPFIDDLVKRAFDQPDEANLVRQLRQDGAAKIEHVAVEGEHIVGHVMLSAMESPPRSLGLAPLSVAPEREGEGIGGMLVRAGVSAARRQGWQAIFCLGEPDYYEKFGFTAEAAAPYPSDYSGPHFLMGWFGKKPAIAPADYAPAFSGISV